MINEELKNELRKEAERIEEDTEHTFKAQYNDAARWRKYHFRMAVAAAFFAATAGFSAIADFTYGTAVIIVAAFLSASISAISSVLKPLERSELHHKAGTFFQHLRDDARIFRTITLKTDVEEKALSDTVQLLSNRRSELREKSPQPSSKAYKEAKSGIDAGEAVYRTDNK